VKRHVNSCFEFLQCSDLTRVLRDAGGNKTVNKLADYSDKTEV